MKIVACDFLGESNNAGCIKVHHAAKMLLGYKSSQPVVTAIHFQRNVMKIEIFPRTEKRMSIGDECPVAVFVFKSAIKFLN